jgi:hypothetical protein
MKCVPHILCITQIRDELSFLSQSHWIGGGFIRTVSHRSRAPRVW